MNVHGAGLAALAGWVGLTWVSRATAHSLVPFLLIQAWQWLIFLWILGRIETSPGRGKIGSILGWAVAFRLCGWAAWPLMEDDYFRFLWDGFQLVATGNPYAAAPAAFFTDPSVPERFQDILDQINYPHVPTIYGPVCQLLFGASYLIAPAELWAWKLCVLIFDLGWLVLVVALSRSKEEAMPGASRPVARAVLIVSWAPLMVFETSYNAHPDIIGVALLTLALLCQRRGRMAWAGWALGLAVGAKVFAVLLVPFVLGRSWRGWVAFVAVVPALYLPFWLQGGTADVGGLIAYGRTWEFNSSLFAIAQWLSSPQLSRVLCGGLFVGLWVWLLLRQELGRTPERPGTFMPPGLLILGAFFLLSPTVNPWYLLWLAPFLVGRASPTALAAWAFVSLSYITGLNLGDPSLNHFQHPVWVRPVEYGGMATVAFWEWSRTRSRTL